MPQRERYLLFSTGLPLKERRDFARGLIRFRIVAVAEQDHGEALPRPAQDDVAEADALAGVPDLFVAVLIVMQAPTVAVPVDVGFTGDARVRRERQLARFVVQQPAVIKRRIPLRQILDVGIDAAVAARGAGGVLVGAHPFAAGFAVSIGAVRYLR